MRGSISGNKPICAWVIALAVIAVMGSQGAESAPVPVIDVLMTYTPDALEQYGPDLPTKIQRMVDDANGVFLNSHAKARIRLVATAKVAYAEPGYDLQLTLNRLADPNDGYLDEVHVLRAQYAADLVVLVVRGQPWSDDFLAPLYPDPTNAFAVITSTGDYTFARLLGRILGCEAERGPVEELGVVVGEGVFADSHAYTFTNGEGVVQGTVMARRCGSWLPMFSNPEVQYFGHSMGITGVADNVRTINITAQQLAAFQGPANSVVPPLVNWTAPTSGAVFLPGTDIDLSIDATASIGAIQKVEVFQMDFRGNVNGNLIGTRFAPNPDGRFHILVTNAPAGWYQLSARATDDHDQLGQSEIYFRVCAPNDNFTNRVQLRTPSDRVPFNLAGMSLESGEAALSPAGVEATGWFSWTAPGDGFLRAQAFPNNSWYTAPLLRGYYGAAIESLSPAHQPPNTDEPFVLVVPVSSGDILQISAIAPRTDTVDALAGQLVADFLPAVTNDLFEMRVPLNGRVVEILGNNIGARSATNAVWTTPPGPTVWWTWTPPISGVAVITSTKHTLVQRVSVFRGNQPETLSLLAEYSLFYLGDLHPGFPVQAGEPLQIAVTSSQDGLTGDFALTVQVLPNAENESFLTRLQALGAIWSAPLIFPGEASSGNPPGVGRYSAWWEWQAPASGKVIVWVNGYDSPWVSVFTGNSLSTLQPVPGATSGWGSAVLPAEAGVTYEIVTSWAYIPYYLGSSNFTHAVGVIYPAPNDQFENRVPLSGSSVDWSLTNRFGTLEPGEPNLNSL